MIQNKKIILASGSPRRRELIKLLGIPFECVSVEADESTTQIIPHKAVEEIASKKARAALALCKLEDDEIIIGADTIVVFEGKLLGKPRDDRDAMKMLTELSGNSHQVYTGVCIIYRSAEGEIKEIAFAEKTQVDFEEISQEEIKRYIATGNHKDKAGSYAIQDEFSVHVKGISGDYNNVVGFPIARIYKEIRNISTKK